MLRAKGIREKAEGERHRGRRGKAQRHRGTKLQRQKAEG